MGPTGKVTVPAVASRKVARGDDPIVMVTAYDAPGARIAEDAGVDLVLLATSTRAAARLEALGIKVVALEPRNMADVRRVLAQVGRARRQREARTCLAAA